jgi:hypothetical protein
MVYEVAAWLFAGDPDIAQVVLDIDKPVGSGGIVIQFVGVPPAITGVTVVMGVPFVRENGEPE